MISYAGTIEIEKNVGLKCCGCEHIICNEDDNWKEKVLLDERSLAEVGGEAYAGTHDDIMLRQFYCPNCGSLFDSEIALKGEPFLRDHIDISKFK